MMHIVVTGGQEVENPAEDEDFSKDAVDLNEDWDAVDDDEDWDEDWDNNDNLWEEDFDDDNEEYDRADTNVVTINFYYTPAFKKVCWCFCVYTWTVKTPTSYW